MVTTTSQLDHVGSLITSGADHVGRGSTVRAAWASTVASVSRAVSQIADSSLLLWTTISLITSAVIAGPLANRMERSWLGTFLALASLFEIIVITLAVREGALFHPGLDGLPLSDRVGWWRNGWEASRVIDPANSEWLLNVVLFVPAGLAWTAVTRNAPLTLVWLAMLSFLIETVQSITGAGAPDPADLVANSTGALIGVVLGALWVLANGRGEGISPRGVLVGSIGVVAVVVGLFVTVQVLADRRIDKLDRELHTQFDSATRSIIGSGEDSGATFQEFMAMTSVRPDSIVYSDDNRVADVRYAIEYFGVHRCVFVQFSADGTTFRREGGTTCTRARG